MKKLCLTLLICYTLFISGPLVAQEKPADGLSKIYRGTPARINDLVHTKLNVSFDYKKRYLYGKEWVTLKPHFYPTDTLRLDAKGMDLKHISIIKYGKNVPLKFSYDSLTVAITLDRVYHNNESYTIYLDYTAKPNELKTSRKQGKGLYFINPDGTEKDKPTQIWTEGEPESSSVWFPTKSKNYQRDHHDRSGKICYLIKRPACLAKNKYRPYPYRYMENGPSERPLPVYDGRWRFFNI
jgi:aminopeptidase N